MPAGLTPEKLSNVRAQFITNCGWGDSAEIKKSFMERDAQLRSCNKFEKILLWFEHDLYDQLQVVQLLDYFYHYPVHDDIELSIICTNRYLEILSTDEMLGLYKYKEPITEK